MAWVQRLRNCDWEVDHGVRDPEFQSQLYHVISV